MGYKWYFQPTKSSTITKELPAVDSVHAGIEYADSELDIAKDTWVCINAHWYRSSDLHLIREDLYYERKK